MFQGYTERQNTEKIFKLKAGLDWIEHGFTSPPTKYRLYGRRFLQVKRPNQQYKTTEGKKLQRKTQKSKKYKKTHMHTHTK